MNYKYKITINNEIITCAESPSNYTTQTFSKIKNEKFQLNLTYSEFFISFFSIFKIGQNKVIYYNTDAFVIQVQSILEQCRG